MQHKCEQFLMDHFEELQARKCAKENINQQIKAQLTTALLKIDELQDDEIEEAAPKED